MTEKEAAESRDPLELKFALWGFSPDDCKGLAKITRGLWYAGNYVDVATIAQVCLGSKPIHADRND